MTDEDSSYPSSYQIDVRDPFSMQSHLIPRELVETKKFIESAKDVPTPCLLQYFSWRVHQKTMPIAGLVTTVGGSNGAFVSNSDAKDRLTRGDRMFIFRVTPEPNSTYDSDIVSRLPIDATVLQVQENGCDINTQVSNIRTLWSDSEELLPGDIVCPPNQFEDLKLFVSQFELLPPPPKVFDDLSLGSERRLREFNSHGRNIIDTFAIDLHSTMSETGLNVLRLQPGNAPESATHTITGDIEPVTRHRFQISVRLLDKDGVQLMTGRFMVDDDFFSDMTKEKKKR